jgi:hypothetical protein
MSQRDINTYKTCQVFQRISVIFSVDARWCYGSGGLQYFARWDGGIPFLRDYMPPDDIR